LRDLAGVPSSLVLQKLGESDQLQFTFQGVLQSRGQLQGFSPGPQEPLPQRVQ
jgi:hypothetical protein